MKKLLLTLGTAVSIATPIAAVVACGNNTTNTADTTNTVNTTKTPDTTDKNAAPTQGIMFSVGEIPIIKLIGGFAHDENAQLTAIDKSTFKNIIPDDAAALTIVNASGKVGCWKTKAEWDTFIDSSTLGKLRPVLSSKVIEEYWIKWHSGSNKVIFSPNFVVPKDILNKDSTKAEAIIKINKIFADKPKQKQIYTSFVNNQPSWEQAYFMLKFMARTSNPKYTKSFLLTYLLKSIKDSDGKYATEEEKEKYLINKIQSRSMDIIAMANGIIDKYSGKDSDFYADKLLNIAKVDTSQKELIKGKLWDIESLQMGGDETVKYIIGKIGYKLVDR